MTQSQLPQIDVTTFFLSISSAALMNLGIKAPFGPDEKEKEFPVNLPIAQQNIDLLELMKDKTKGNLSDQESKLLEQLLFELKMKFVEAEKKEIELKK